MKENMNRFITKIKDFWIEKDKKQKGVLIGSVLFMFILLFGLSFSFYQTKYTTLYNGLSLSEAGQIKDELDIRGISYELEDGGTSIKVPVQHADALIVDLAGKGIPQSGNTGFSFFSENASWGITDNEFSMIKLDATRTELANLIKSIDGIDDANVMVTMPKESVFVSDSIQEASAAIILDTRLGYEFQGNQIEALYHLVSKAVPNLPMENIFIMNQYSEYFDRATNTAFGDQENYTHQQVVKKDIERDVQRRLQQMLGAMIGMDRVIVSVIADIDFTKENRIEEIVEPVDLENMEGLPVSIESIQETYSGNQAAGGVVGTGEEDIPGYEGATTGDDGEYELVKETINNEFNRIRKDIVESPYKVRDLGIQVAVDNATGMNGTEVEYLTNQEQELVEADITSILNSIVTTSIDEKYGAVDTTEKISIVFQEFSHAMAETTETSLPSSIPLWLYIVAAILLVIIIILIIMLLRNRTKTEEVSVQTEVDERVIAEVPDITEETDTEAEIRKKQLAQMAEEKPEDFAKLLRSWISED